MVRIWSVDIRYRYGYIHILQEGFYWKSEKNERPIIENFIKKFNVAVSD